MVGEVHILLHVMRHHTEGFICSGVAHWRESLSQISTIYTDAKHAADVEEKVGCTLQQLVTSYSN